MNLYLILDNEINIFRIISNYLYLKNKNPEYKVYIYNSSKLSEKIKKYLIFDKSILFISNDKADLSKDTFYIIKNKSTLFDNYIINGKINRKYIFNKNVAINLGSMLLCPLKFNFIRNKIFIIKKEKIKNKNVYFLVLDTNSINTKKNEMCLLTKLKDRCYKTIINTNYNISKNKLLLKKIKEDNKHYVITNLGIDNKLIDPDLNIKSNIMFNFDILSFYSKYLLDSNLNIYINKHTKNIKYFKSFNHFYKNKKINELDLIFDSEIDLFLEYNYLNDKLKNKFINKILERYNININLKSNINDASLILTTDKNNNKDNNFSDIHLFNELIDTIPYLLSLEFYFDIDLSINETIHYPIKNIWQSPAITEYMSYLQIRFSDKIKNYVAFPWAILYDNHIIRKKNNKLPLIFLDLYSKILKRDIFNNGITVIQIIDWREYIPIFKLLGIKKVFASHCSKKEIYGDIEVYPYFLYSYTYNIYNNNFNNLYSNMIISVSTNKSREKLCDDLNISDNINIKKNKDWFFKKLVYDYQLFHKFIETDKIESILENHINYMKFIKNSSFQLCLKGRGDNTIRIFESLKMGIVPVIDFELNIQSDHFNLKDYIIKIDFDELIQYIKIKCDISDFLVDNIKFYNLVNDKRNNIKKDYCIIKLDSLYKKYIENNI
jgi:hypothetical protein